MTDSLVFRQQFPPPPPCEWLCISFDRSDRLKFVEAPSDELAAAVLQTLGPNVSRTELSGGCLEIKFRGSPWRPSGTETVATRVMLLRLLETMERFGYSLYGSLNQESGNEGREADVLYLHRQKNWTPGMPVFHR